MLTKSEWFVNSRNSQQITKFRFKCTCLLIKLRQNTSKINNKTLVNSYTATLYSFQDEITMGCVITDTAMHYSELHLKEEAGMEMTCELQTQVKSKKTTTQFHGRNVVIVTNNIY